jgi:hypothetical protein
MKNVVKMQSMTRGNVSQHHEMLHDILISICIASQLLLHLLSFLLFNLSALTIVLVYLPDMSDSLPLQSKAASSCTPKCEPSGFNATVTATPAFVTSLVCAMPSRILYS